MVRSSGPDAGRGNRLAELVGRKTLGRPRSYRERAASQLLGELAKGRSLCSVCEDEGMPSVQTVFNWMQEVGGFFERYARAMEARADVLAEQILDIVDDGRNDWMESNDPENPGYRFNGEAFQRARLRMDARKWIASKFKPNKFGDRVTSVLEGGERPVQIADDGARAAAVAALLVAAGARALEQSADAEEHRVVSAPEEQSAVTGLLE